MANGVLGGLTTTHRELLRRFGLLDKHIGASVIASHNYPNGYGLHDSLTDICMPRAKARDHLISLILLPIS